MRKNRISLVLAAVVLAICFCFTGFAADGPPSSFAGGSGTADDPYQIENADQLMLISDNLSAHFLLTADIDLSSSGSIQPFGAFVPVSDEPEDAENPNMDLAFTGSFDGGGFTISNASISDPEGMGVALFGCVAGEDSSISNLTVENIRVEGGMLVGGVIGFAGFTNTVENVSLTGNNAITGGDMMGGIVGGGFCEIVNCTAETDITYVNEGEASEGGIGVLAGGMENASIINSNATGSITATNDGVTSVGGLAGCAYNSAEVTGCTADVTITLGENAVMIGGLLGHAGTYDAANPTLISGCSVNAAITAPDSAERIGGIVGSGFYMSAYSELIPAPAIFSVADCQTSGSIDGGSIVGSIAAYTYTDSTVENCTSDMAVNDEADAPQVGATADDVPLEDLK